MKKLTDEENDLLDALRQDLVDTCIRLNKNRRSLTRAAWSKEYQRLLTAAEALPAQASFNMEPLAMMEPGFHERSG
jgi:hypothetical protein